MNTFMIIAHYGDKQRAIRFKTEKTLQEVKAGIVAESGLTQDWFEVYITKY